jgi:hypothetical protein
MCREWSNVARTGRLGLWLCQQSVLSVLMGMKSQHHTICPVLVQCSIVMFVTSMSPFLVCLSLHKFRSFDLLNFRICLILKPCILRMAGRFVPMQGLCLQRTAEAQKRIYGVIQNNDTSVAALEDRRRLRPRGRSGRHHNLH